MKYSLTIIIVGLAITLYAILRPSPVSEELRRAAAEVEEERRYAFQMMTNN
jgi:hypothetical protein